MAKSINNDATFGLSGKFGKMFGFRQIAGETEAFRRPGKRTKPATADQLSHQERFTQASFYAKAVNADPVRKALYKPKATGRKSVYNVALADAMQPPVIHFINTDLFTGQVGDQLVIRAVDDFKVSQVSVTISALNGTLVEQGNAVAMAGGVDWSYTLVNQPPAGIKVTASAFDLPGNKTVMEITT